MGWAKRKRNPPPTDTPPAPDDDSRFDEATGGDAIGPTQGQIDALKMADALDAFDKSPSGHALMNALPYIIPLAVGMSVVSWGAYMYFMFKRSKHYYG
jgi:hypothetical protein